MNTDLKTFWESGVSEMEQKGESMAIPTRFYARYDDGEIFVVVSDNETVFTFASQTKHIYAAVAKKCHPLVSRKGGKIVEYYQIDKNALQMISCVNPKTRTLTQNFVCDVIIDKAFA